MPRAWRTPPRVFLIKASYQEISQSQGVGCPGSIGKQEFWPEKEERRLKDAQSLLEAEESCENTVKRLNIRDT